MNYKLLKLTAVYVCCSLLCVLAASADELKLHLIRAPNKINWKSVNGMLISTIRNSQGPKPKSSYILGHFAIEINCSRANGFEVSHLLTGMSLSDGKAANKFVKTSGVGLGALFYPFAGTLDSSAGLLDDFKIMNELNRYQTLSLPTTTKKCQQMLSFMETWIENASYSVYGGGKDAASGEGAGCADFAEQFYKIATGKNFPDNWIVEKKVPVKLIGVKESRVSLARLLLRKNWAKKKEDFILYRTPDPTRAFDEVAAGLDTSQMKADALQDDDLVGKIEFKYKYPSLKNPAAIWQSINLTE